MRSLLLVILVVGFCKETRSQGLTPIFKLKADSLAYSSIADTAYDQRREFLNNHDFVLRTLYRQNRNYTPWQSLYTIRNKDSITKISILGKGRTSLPDSIHLYKNLTELELINFKLSKLPKELLSGSKITKLIISNNFPSKKLKLPKNSSIDTLIIHGDENGKLPKSYRKFNSLQFLQLTHNNIKSFPDLSGCHYLARVDLNFNEIKVVPRSVRRYRSLRSINLNNNPVSKIKPGIEKLRGLEELDLYKGNLSEIPPMLYTMTALKVIDLFSNHIKIVSPQIANLKNLEILYIAGNEIATLPEEIGELSHLREMYIHHNHLYKLPVSLGKLTSLYTLRMNNNFLSEWPKSVMELKNLKNLDCSDNPWSPEAKLEISAWAKFLRSNNTFVVE